MNTFYRGDDGRIHSLGDSSELRHWKYIKKIPVGQGFRYFYSWDEYRAYLADPTAELQKTGQKAANQLQSAGRQAGKDVRSAGRSAQKQISKGRNKVERAIKTADRSKMTVSGVKQANASKPESTRKRLNDLAKKISQKWNSSKEAVKEAVEKGKKWIENKKSEREEAKKTKIEQKKEAENNKREQIAKKYKYLQKVTKNGKTYYFYTEEEIRAYQKRNEYYKNDPSFMKDIKHSNVPYTVSEDSMLVNPKYDLYDYDSRYEYNCAECSAIYELRRRGYDVESNGESGIGDNADKYNTEKRFDLFYENANVQKPKATNNDEDTYNAIKSEIEKNPPGSRGDLSVAWKNGGGHSMVWERDTDGNIHIIDAQAGGDGGRVEYDLKDITDMTDNSSSTGKEWGMKKNKPVTTVTRTDNVRLKEDIVKICKESPDEKKRPSTKYKMTIDLRKGEVHYVPMTEEEIVKEYSNVLTQRSKY